VTGPMTLGPAAFTRGFPADEWHRLRLVTFVLACAGLALAGSGVMATAIFHQPTTIKYAVTVVSFGFLALLTTVREPFRLLVGIAVFVAPIDSVFTLQGAQLTPLLVIDLLAVLVAMPRLGTGGSRLKLAAGAFALLLLPAVAQADVPGRWLVWLAVTVVTGWLVFLVALESKGVRYVVRAMVISAVFQAVIAIYEFRTKHQLNLYGASGSQAAGGHTFFLYGSLLRPSGTLPDPIGLGQVLALYLPLMIAYAATLRRVSRCALVVCTAGLVGLALSLSLSRMSIVGGGVGMLLTLVALPSRGRWRVGSLVTVVASLVITLAFGLGGSSLRARFDSILHPTAAHVRTAAGDVARTHIWTAALHIGEANAAAGVGLGNIRLSFPRFGVPVNAGVNAQNTPLQFFAEAGLPGLIALLLVLLAAFRDLGYAFRDERVWAAGCLGALTATLVTWSTDVEVRLVPVSATVAVLLAVIAALAARRAGAPSDAAEPVGP
jgi:O-Antigen ligase